jgi:hypothetical protein
MREECAVCRRPTAHADAGADVRLYLGPGDKLAELWLPLCPEHVERFRLARQQDVVECRVGGVTHGRPEPEAER